MTPSPTTNAKSVPEWAMREFCDRANLNFDQAFRGPNTVVLRSAIRAGGKLIAEHEEAPVDPLEVEFKKWIETYCGRFDPETTAMRFTANEMRKAFMGGAKLAGEQK